MSENSYVRVQDIFNGALIDKVNLGLERCQKDIDDREAVPGKRSVNIRLTIAKNDSGVSSIGGKVEVKLPGRYEPDFFATEGTIAWDKNQLVFNMATHPEEEDEEGDGEDDQPEEDEEPEEADPVRQGQPVPV